MMKRLRTTSNSLNISFYFLSSLRHFHFSASHCTTRGCFPAGHLHAGVPLDWRECHWRRERQRTHLCQQVHQRGDRLLLLIDRSIFLVIRTLNHLSLHISISPPFSHFIHVFSHQSIHLSIYFSISSTKYISMYLSIFYLSISLKILQKKSIYLSS